MPERVFHRYFCEKKGENMCRVTVTDEDGLYQTCLVENETPRGILRHFRINPETKIVYMNGKILTKDQMIERVPEYGMVHIAIENRTTLRAIPRF